jgi:hypothetical protein
MISGHIISKAVTKPYVIDNVVYEDRILLLPPKEKFSESLLIDKMIIMNIKFPAVVLAQAIQESNSYKSGIFLENNNLFGMKNSTQRPTTAIGENRGHALYDSWEDSVLDYALYQTTYLKDIKTEKNYLIYLNKNYAEDPSYDENLRRNIKRTKELVSMRIKSKL